MNYTDEYRKIMVKLVDLTQAHLKVWRTAGKTKTLYDSYETDIAGYTLLVIDNPGNSMLKLKAPNGDILDGVSIPREIDLVAVARRSANKVEGALESILSRLVAVGEVG